MKLTERQKYRLLEMVPGAIVWATLIAAVVLSFVRPLWVIGFIIVFDLYWLTRILYFTIFLISSWRKFREVAATDWEAKLVGLPNADQTYHVIFLPTYKEAYGVLKSTLDGLAASKFPKERMIVVLAGEERDRDRFMANVTRLRAFFGNTFLRFLTTLHPIDQLGEIPGKGSNLNFAGRQVKEVIDAMGIPPERIVVSSFDVDTVVHPQYFAYLTYTYCTVPDPTRSSYQPMAVYNNNMWHSPAAVRVAAFGTTFWLMTELPRPEFMSTFSSHSMPWKALTEVGFWQKDIVTEDSRIYLQALLHYDGNYRVTPLYLPVSMDTVGGATLGQSLKNLYRQQRRWAWGVEHFPYLVTNFKKHPKFPRWKRVALLVKLSEGMHSWATAPILMFVLGHLPLYLTRGTDRDLALVANTPFTLQALMTLAMLGTILSAILAVRMLPPRPQEKQRWNWLIMLAQWALLPVTFILFGSIPATDAQTRLMLGKYLGFNVSQKRIT